MAFIKRSTIKTSKNVKVGTCTKICALCGVPFVSDKPEEFCQNCIDSKEKKTPERD